MTIEKDYNLWSHAVALVAESCMADQEEILDDIKRINEMIGTGYYDGEGDELLQFIADYLTKKCSE